MDADTFGRALDLMLARGPDDRGIYEEREVLLGHRRLAIIDLSSGGHQPMELRSASFQRDGFPLGRYGFPRRHSTQAQRISTRKRPTGAT